MSIDLIVPLNCEHEYSRENVRQRVNNIVPEDFFRFKTSNVMKKFTRIFELGWQLFFADS